MKKLRERDIEAYLKKQVKLRGGVTRKVKWIGRRGAPDRRVMLPGGAFWVELKAPGEKLEPHQAREITRMRAYGEQVVVMSELPHVDFTLSRYA